MALEARKLAKRSQISANEIDGLSVEGVDVFERAGELIGNVIPETQKVTGLIEETALQIL